MALAPLASSLVLAALLLPALSGADAGDGPLPAQGMDVGQASRRIRDLVDPQHADKPWAEAIADLSSNEPSAQRSGIAALIRTGPPVLGDLGVLARDQDPLLRIRVIEVAGGIGGTPPAPLMLSLSRDPERHVRQEAVLGLGLCRGPGVYERLAEALGAPAPEERDAAARAMGALADIRALSPLSHLDQEVDDLARRDEGEALQRIASQARAIPDLCQLLLTTRGQAGDALVRACAELGDPRLCPALVEVAASATSPLSRWLALQALAHDGDSRAWSMLCRTAADAVQPELREAAAASMRALTGSPGEGQAWTVWWQDHAQAAPRQNAIDAFLAELHDPQAPIQPGRLQEYTVQELAPLIDGALGAGAAWWPARAFAAMHADEPRRWSSALTRRELATTEPTLRLALTILIDQLGGPSCLENLRQVQADLQRRTAAESALAQQGHLVPDRGPELLALRVAFERRHQRL